MNGNMNPALEDLTVRNLQLEAEVATLKADLDRSEKIAEMWRKDIQKWSQQWSVAESRLRGSESRNTEMQRKHKAEMRAEKNHSHSNGWAAGYGAAERTNTRENVSDESCGGQVVQSWQVKGTRYFLRDDQSAGLCDYGRYSLFRTGEHYGRVIIFRMSLDNALKACPQQIKEDLHSLNGSRQ
jgi:hypothetical protein